MLKLINWYRPRFLPADAAAAGTPAVEEDAPAPPAPREDAAVVCPNAGMPLWSWHPRVYLEVTDEGVAVCPYCGMRYSAAPGAGAHGFGTTDLHQHRVHSRLRPAAHGHAAGPAGASDGGPMVLRADAFGSTTGELITRWLRRE